MKIVVNLVEELKCWEIAYDRVAVVEFMGRRQRRGQHSKSKRHEAELTYLHVCFSHKSHKVSGFVSGEKAKYVQHVVQL